MRLVNFYKVGKLTALQKFGMAPPSAVDEFVANVEEAKDAPPMTPESFDPSISEGSESLPLPENPSMALGV